MSESKLTTKQKVFITEVAKGKSGTQAALVAYDTTSVNTAKNIASENMAKPNVKEALAPILAKYDISLDTAIAPVGDALKDDDINIRLKGHDRATKLLDLNTQDQRGSTYNFVQVIQEQKDRYGV